MLRSLTSFKPFAPTTWNLVFKFQTHGCKQDVTNDTTLETFQCDKMGVGRRFYDTVVVKVTVTLSDEPVVAKQQAPIYLADEPWDGDRVEVSSLKRAGDVLLYKPSTDVIVTGTARAPRGQPTQNWDAAVEVIRGSETVLASQAQVLGPRWWRHTTAHGWELTNPEPTLEVPIRYAWAYGGAYPVDAPASEAQDPDAPPPPRWVVHPPNPSGTGFFDVRAMDPAQEYRAPQWQQRAHPIERWNHEVPVAGFGPISRVWSTRLRFAGTYDAAWVKKVRAEAAEGLPADYASDFDARFFQCAHPSLITPTWLEGDEHIVLRGLMPDVAPRVARLPRVTIAAVLRNGSGEIVTERLPLDTVHIDVDDETVSLCWRLSLSHERDIRAAILNLVRLA